MAIPFLNDITVAGSITIPTTTSSTTGVIYKGADRFIHNFGSNNFFAGAGAGNFTMTGFSNTSIGRLSLRSDTTGYQNVALGSEALLSNTTGYRNTAIGSDALKSHTEGINNTGVGNDIFSTLTTGSNNTGIGRITGQGITTGSGNTIIGANVTGLTAALTNNIIIADGTGNRRINVDSSGNVGIGTTTPTSKLQITGTAISNELLLIQNTDTGGVASSLTVKGTGSASSAVIDLDRSVVGRIAGTRYSTSGATNYFSGLYYNGGNSQSNFGIGTDRDISNQKLVITPAGNVGIGTTNPNALLHGVSGGSYSPNTLYGINADYIFSANNSELALSLNGANGTYWMQTRNNSDAAIALAINPEGGNVGIGSIDPDELIRILSVLFKFSNIIALFELSYFIAPAVWSVVSPN